MRARARGVLLILMLAALPALHAHALNFGEGQIDAVAELDKIIESGHQTGPNEQSLAIERKYYRRLIESRTEPGKQGKLRFRVEPRSPDRAAVLLMTEKSPVPKTTRYRLLSAAGDAVALPVGDAAERRILAEDEDLAAVLAADSGWTPAPFRTGASMKKGVRWLFRTTVDTPRAGDWTLSLAMRGSKGRATVYLNGKQAAPPQAGYELKVPVGRHMRAGPNQLAVLIDYRRPVANRLDERSVGLKAWLASSPLIDWSDVSHPYYAFFEGVPASGTTTLCVTDGSELIDHCVIDFGSMRTTPAAVQFADLLKPTDTHGSCLAAGNRYMFEDGTQGWFFGGHENHPPSHETTRAYVETCRSIGANVLRLIPGPELVLDYATSELDPEMLDRIHYLTAELGKAGIYLHLTLTSYGRYNHERDPGNIPEGAYTNPFIRGKPFTTRGPAAVTPIARMVEPRLIELEKTYARNLLTPVNPYTGKALKDDPTLMTVEIANEVGLGGRRFDWTSRADPKHFDYRMKAWNQYLLNKYGAMGDTYYKEHPLYKQWYAGSFYKPENPDADTVNWPRRFNGNRHLGGRGLSGTWYLDGTRRIADPRISDAMECMTQVQQKWLKTHFDYLRNTLGVRVGIGSSSDGFNIYQVGARRANVMAGLDVTDGQAYGGRSQITRGFGGWGYLRSSFYVQGRPSFAREWGSWYAGSNEPWQFIVLASVLARHNGYDGFTHHKFHPYPYPSTDAARYRKDISPFGDKRRGAYAVGAWIMQRSRIQEPQDKIVLGFPRDDALYGGANVPFANAIATSFLQDQLPTEEYHFDDIYEGPVDRVVFHDGRGPHGDYRKARHAVLWSHGITDRFAQDVDAKRKWFALHGVTFKAGERYVLTDRVFAIAGDIHDDKEFPDKLYDALASWGIDMPFAKEEIGKVWRSVDRTIEIDFGESRMTADRSDFQLWMGRWGKGKRAEMSRLSIVSDEKNMDAMLLPFDSADFRTSQKLLLWCLWNAEMTVRGSFTKPPEIYAVNWLGTRLFRIQPSHCDESSVTFMTKRDDDTFFYEILR